VIIVVFAILLYRAALRFYVFIIRIVYTYKTRKYNKIVQHRNHEKRTVTPHCLLDMPLLCLFK